MGWARTALRVEARGVDARGVGELIGVDSEGAGERPVWAIDLVEASSETLNRQFERAELFIRAHLDGFARLPESAEVALLVSWTPAAGQDGLCVPAGLIQVMSQVGALLLIDTYTDD